MDRVKKKSNKIYIYWTGVWLSSYSTPGDTFYLVLGVLCCGLQFPLEPALRGSR